MTDESEGNMTNLVTAGPISDAIAGAIALLANSPYFQTWTGAADSTAAKAFILTAESGYPIVSVSIASNVLTVTTRDKHALIVGQVVTLAGAALGAESAINIVGQYTIVAVTASTFTAAITHADASLTNLEFCFVEPSARPIAVVTAPDDGALQSQQTGTGGGMSVSGKIDVVLEADTNSSYINDPTNARLDAGNALGQLIQSMHATNDTGLATFTDTNGASLEFVAENIDLSVSPQFTAKSEQDDNAKRFERWRALIEMTWGVQG